MDSAPDGIEIWPGKAYPLGATWDGLGVNFALFSANATKVELCLFDDDGAETRVDLLEVDVGGHRLGPGVRNESHCGQGKNNPHRDPDRAGRTTDLEHVLIEQRRRRTVTTSMLQCQGVAPLRQFDQHPGGYVVQVLEAVHRRQRPTPRRIHGEPRIDQLTCRLLHRREQLIAGSRGVVRVDGARHGSRSESVETR